MNRTSLFVVLFLSTIFGQNQAQIDSINQLLIKLPHNSQLAVAIINKDNVSYYGAINLNGTIEVIENYNHIFEIGSITKVMTSTILANLVYEGKISLDKSLQDHVPYKLKHPKKDDVTVTVQMLSNHSSGLIGMPLGMIFSSFFKPKNPYENYDLPRMEKYFKKKMKMNRTPGESILYSNIGVGYLGHVLGYVAEKPYKDLLDKYVIKKYDMISTTLDRNLIGDRLVKGVNKKGKVVSNWDLNAFAPAGGVLSTVEDLAHFAQAHFGNDPALGMQMKKTAQFSEQVDIGLGWFIFYDKEGNAIYWHNGGTNGYTSDMSVSAKSQKSVVILSNVSAYVKETGQYRDLNFTLLSLIE